MRNASPIYPGLCAYCSRSFVGRQPWTKYCSTSCRTTRKSHPVLYFNCGCCGALATGRRVTARFCSDTCRDRAKNSDPDRNRAKNRRRRLLGRTGTYRLIEVAARDGYRCHLCQRKVDMSLSGDDRRGPTIDHLIPISKGGDDVESNVALAHRSCNCSRGDRGAVQLRLSA